MLKDITLGQYFPGNSLIHRLDPRTKILAVIVYITVIFCIKSLLGYAVIGAFTVSCVLFSKIPFKFVLKGLKPIMIFIVITAVFNIDDVIYLVTIFILTFSLIIIEHHQVIALYHHISTLNNYC